MIAHAVTETVRHFLAGLFVCLQAVIAVYGFHRYVVLGLFYRHGRRPPPPPPVVERWPAVTVQLPVRDEVHVVERLVDAACALDYPAGRLEIQVLDDSSDQTTALAEARAAYHRARGIDVRVLHRGERRGFKAGALNGGLARARGELLAVFDADFLPPRDFLRRVVPHFGDRAVGMVQARWGHVNGDYSWLSRTQALFLDAHFLVEQIARGRSGRFFNFNGTAGVWRRACIAELGGWCEDNLTEDLELSYRAQLAGWRFVYVPDVVAPAELPVDIHAFKIQQRRWAKGAMQTARAMLPEVWASRLPWRVKLEAFFHLTCNLTFPVMLVSTALLPVVLLAAPQSHGPVVLAWSLLMAAATSGASVFLVVTQRLRGASWARAAASLPGALLLGLGMSLSQARAVLEGLVGRAGEWERTPKYAVVERREEWRRKQYGERAREGHGEALLALFFAGVLALAVVRDRYAPVPFLALLVAGLSIVAWLSFRHHVRPAAALVPAGEAPLGAAERFAKSSQGPPGARGTTRIGSR